MNKYDKELQAAGLAARSAAESAAWSAEYLAWSAAELEWQIEKVLEVLSINE